MTDGQIGAALRGKLVVLLGGTGFFGRHLAQELLARGRAAARCQPEP